MSFRHKNLDDQASRPKLLDSNWNWGWNFETPGVVYLLTGIGGLTLVVAMVSVVVPFARFLFKVHALTYEVYKYTVACNLSVTTDRTSVSRLRAEAPTDSFELVYRTPRTAFVFPRNSFLPN